MVETAPPPVDKSYLAKVLLERRRARAGLLAFTQFTKPDYRVNWHHEVMAAALDRVLAGTCRRLIIQVPPRHGKSELVSRRLPALFFGQRPGKPVILSSYSADLSNAMSRDCQAVVKSDEYRELFPGASPKDGVPLSVHEWRVPNGGTFLSAGVGGGITGRGFELGIIDDPVKNDEEAHSQTIRDKVWRWYTSTFYTRRAPEARIVVCMTRWHEDDLVGRILNEADAGEWEVITFPALAEAGVPDDPRQPGEPLWESQYGLDDLEVTRRQIGSMHWSALFQQRPAPASGGIFKRQHFRYYTANGTLLTELDANRTSDSHAWRRFATMDVAVTTKDSSDWTVLGIWAQSPDKRLWLLDLIRDRMETPALLDLIASARHRYGVPAIYIESNGVGLPVFQSAQARKLPVMPVEQHKDKVSRAQAATPWFERGDVMFPRDAPWLSVFEAELLSFPAAAHDDQCDCLTTAIALADQALAVYDSPGAVLPGRHQRAGAVLNPPQKDARGRPREQRPAASAGPIRRSSILG